MAAPIPKQFIDELLARVDIVDVIEQYIPLRKAGRDYQALCPFHQEKTPSFTVSRQKQFYYCFGCSASGSAIGFLMDFADMEFPEAVAALAATAGMTVPAADTGVPRGPDSSGLYEALAASQRWYARQLREHPAAQRAVDYLKGRGLSGEIAARFGIGFAPPGWDNLLRALGTEAEAVRRLTDAGLLVPRDGGHYDRFRDRIMFPIHDQRGRVVGFGGRVLSPQEQPKYLNSPETPVFHKGRELYGLYQARRAEREPERLLVVEGYMDVVALAQHGVTNAVAALGTATTREQLERLFRVVPEVVFCFDGDAAGERAAWRALETALPLLGGGRSVAFLFLPEGEDPDSLVRKEGTARFTDRDTAIPLAEYLFRRLCAQVNLATVDGRSRLGALARPLIDQIPSDDARAPLLQRLGDLTGERSDRRKVPERVPDAVRGPAAPGRTLVRTAITLLLHRPELAAKAPTGEELRASGLPGADLLADMVELLERRPALTTGALLEHWRGSPHGRHLERLAAAEVPIPEEGQEEELRGALQKLRELGVKKLRNLEVGKFRPSELSEEEKAELRARFAGPKGRP